MANRNKPKHIKRVKFSVALPAWHRLLFPYIDSQSNSSALVKLVNYAIQHGAVSALAPQLPPALTDPGELASYLATYAAPPVVATPPNQQAPRPPMTPEQVAAFFDEDGEPDPTPVAPQPIQRQQPRLYTDAELKQLQQEAEAQARAMHLGVQQ